jgi:uncharacterized protein
MDKTALVKASIIGTFIALSAYILGNAFKQRNVAQDSISVTGLGTKDFISDEILFSGSFSCKAADGKEAYNKILSDKEKVMSFFKSKGFTPEQISFNGISLTRQFRSIKVEKGDEYIRTEEIPDGFLAQQTIVLSAKQNPALMAQIEKVSDQTTELINDGIELNINPLQYTYSQLPTLKHALIEAASKDAKERAQKIISSGGGHLGKLKDASMGVFQITGKGEESEDSYGGNNDTHSKNKTARITVRLDYNLK